MNSAQSAAAALVPRSAWGSPQASSDAVRRGLAPRSVPPRRVWELARPGPVVVVLQERRPAVICRGAAGRMKRRSALLKGVRSGSCYVHQRLSGCGGVGSRKGCGDTVWNLVGIGLSGPGMHGCTLRMGRHRGRKSERGPGRPRRVILEGLAQGGPDGHGSTQKSSMGRLLLVTRPVRRRRGPVRSARGWRSSGTATTTRVAAPHVQTWIRRTGHPGGNYRSAPAASVQDRAVFDDFTASKLVGAMRRLLAGR